MLAKFAIFIKGGIVGAAIIYQILYFARIDWPTKIDVPVFALFIVVFAFLNLHLIGNRGRPLSD